MDGNQGPETAPADPAPATAVTDLAALLAVVPAPDSAAALIDEIRDLEDLKSAMAARQAGGRVPGLARNLSRIAPGTPGAAEAGVAVSRRNHFGPLNAVHESSLPWGADIKGTAAEGREVREYMG